MKVRISLSHLSVIMLCSECRVPIIELSHGEEASCMKFYVGLVQFLREIKVPRHGRSIVEGRLRNRTNPSKNLLTVFPRINKHRGEGGGGRMAVVVHSEVSRLRLWRRRREYLEQQMCCRPSSILHCSRIRAQPNLSSES